MIFNSIAFLIFLTLVLSIYYRLQHRAQNIFLLLASYFFYAWWDPRFLVLLWFTSLLDYFVAQRIEASANEKARRWLLAGSITANLTVLGIFKYYNFFADSAARLLDTFGLHSSLPVLNVILPVGISFYTFLSMSYTIDVFRKELKASHNIVEYQLFIAYFPHLVAGPIVRASFLLPQCQRPRVPKRDLVVNGVWLVLMGYFKKVVIGDRLAQVVNWGFSQPTPPFTDLNAWIILYAFAFQIYADFSGYADIARGLSKIMGFELVENFRAPYLVTNPSAFWRNWHISLSTWLRDYLYIPLGGNRGGSLRTYCNLFVTMLLGGLWHGAGAAFLLWGMFHGTLLAIHRFWSGLFGRSPSAEPSTGWIGRVKTVLFTIIFFHLTCLGWLFFRAGSLPKQISQTDVVGRYLHAMVTPLQHGWDGILWGTLLWCGFALFFQWKHDLMERFSEWPTHWQAGATAMALVSLAALGVFEGSQFIYFAF